MLLAINEQAEQERDSARAEVATEQKKLRDLQLEFEAEREQMSRYKEQGKAEADEIAKSHLEKYEQMRKDMHLEREKAVNIAVSEDAKQPLDMVQNLLENGRAERCLGSTQCAECQEVRVGQSEHVVGDQRIGSTTAEAGSSKERH